ncbi:MAG: glycerol-3-phosphate dehydrogenase/oxidase [Candidatus Limnocylindrales bacterium]
MTDPASSAAPPQTPLKRRTADLGLLASTAWDVVIVGGGIVGAGALLDATTRGLKAALVEQDDIASGTSSRSSRLIHGGLRYLEQFHVGLVREALAERSRLLRNAPHLVTLEPLLFPIYGIPFLHKAFYDAGLTLYDLLGARHDGGWHRRLSGADTLEIVPSLHRPGLRGGLLYHDGMEDDARLTLAVLRTALASDGAALALTRVRATGIRETQPGVIDSLLVRDLTTGAEIAVRTRAVVDASGVWAADPTHPFASPSMRILPSRGAHLVVPRERIPSTAGLTIRVPGKIVFLVPWPDHWLIGTTDAPFEGRPDRPAADGWEIDELLATVNDTLDVNLTRADIVGTYAGLRPLIAPSGGSTVKASREHRVTVEPNGIVRIGGGKYTTYRVMARDVIDAVLGRAEAARRPSATADRRVIGSADPPELERLAGELASIPAVAAAHPEAAKRLVARHGTEAAGVVALGGELDLLRPLIEGRAFLEAEVAWAVRHELALSVDDVLSRRLHLSPELADRGRAAAPRVATIMARDLAWGETRCELEAATYLASAAREYAVAASSEPPATEAR